MKKGFIIGVAIAIILSTGLAFANNMVSDVYYSSFPITVNGQAYASEMPILSYQGRTYLPLREFGNATGVNVDFQNNTILVDNYESKYTQFFLTDAYGILSILSQIDKNNDMLFDYYVDFWGRI